MNRVTSEVDIAIVGAGPNGLFAYYRLREAFPHLKIIMLEKGETNESLKKMPDVRWHSSMLEMKLPLSINDFILDSHVPTSKEVSRYFDFFARAIEPDILVNTNVSMISALTQESGLSKVLLQAERGLEKIQIKARYVIVASGVYSSPRNVEVDGSEYFQTSYSIDQQGKRLLLVGGGNSAADFIMHLLPTNSITWVIRGTHWAPVFSNLEGKFREVVVKYASNLELHVSSEIAEATATGHARLNSGLELGPFDSMHALVGFTPVSDMIRRSGFVLEGECVSLSKNFESSLLNVFFFGAAMAKWDSSSARPEPTYVHNGNPSKLNRILSEISSREIGFPSLLSRTSEETELSKSWNSPTYKVLNFLRTKIAFVLVRMRKVVS